MLDDAGSDDNEEDHDSVDANVVVDKVVDDDDDKDVPDSVTFSFAVDATVESDDAAVAVTIVKGFAVVVEVVAAVVVVVLVEIFDVAVVVDIVAGCEHDRRWHTHGLPQMGDWSMS